MDGVGLWTVNAQTQVDNLFGRALNTSIWLAGPVADPCCRLDFTGDFAGAGIALAGVCICWFWPRQVQIG